MCRLPMVSPCVRQYRLGQQGRAAPGQRKAPPALHHLLPSRSPLGVP